MVKARNAIQHNGELFRAGEVFELDDARMIETLHKRGAIELIEAEAAEDDLESKTVAELKTLAKSIGLSGYSTMKRDSLIEAIRSA